MISEEDYNAYFTVGTALALICVENYDLDKEFFKYARQLDFDEKETLKDEIIYCRIALVLSRLKNFNNPQAEKILFEQFFNCIRKNLSAYDFNNLNNKLDEYCDISISDNTLKIILNNADISEKNFKITDFIALKFFIKSDFKKYLDYTERMTEILKSPANKRSQMIKNFNESIGRDFGAAYKLLNDALENKKFNVKNDNSAGIFVFIAIISVALILFAVAPDSNTNNKNVPSAPTVAEKNPPKIEEKTEQKNNTQPEQIKQKIEPTATQPKKQTPPPKKKVVPIPKRGVYTDYDYSQEILNNDGLCEFTVDNTRNDMPVYVRIWDMNVRKPVRAFTIAQGEKFTAYNLSPGRYEVRYKELYENDVPPFGSKSEIFSLQQYETYFGTNYDVMELTLYKVVGGNTRTTQINADDV